MTTYTSEEFENIDINAWRNGYKWTVNECLRLEREYDLLKLSVPEMALLHKRTINAIMCKLQAEGLDTFNNLYVKTYSSNPECFIDDQIAKLNNLASTNDSQQCESDDDDYVPNLNDDDLGLNHAYVFDQVKRIHKHITNLLGYFTQTQTQTQDKKELHLNA